MESGKHFPSDFTQKELFNMMPEFKIILEQVKNNKPLAKLLLTLWGEVLDEAFKQFAGNDQVKRQQLQEIINQDHNH